MARSRTAKVEPAEEGAPMADAQTDHHLAESYDDPKIEVRWSWLTQLADLVETGDTRAAIEMIEGTVLHQPVGER